MQLVFDKSFIKDIRKIKDATQKQKIKKKIEILEQAKSVNTIANLKKLKGHQTAYRIRAGDYRIGFFLLDQETIELVRVLQRKEIYSKFP